MIEYRGGRAVNRSADEARLGGDQVVSEDLGGVPAKPTVCLVR